MPSRITLYRIRSMPLDDTEYYVGQAYRIHTRGTIDLPKDYALHGVHVDPFYIPWLETVLMPVVEQHNGNRIIDRWAVSVYEDPDHVTIALVVDDLLLVPDLLNNTTSGMDGPRRRRLKGEAIHRAITAYDPSVVLPPQDQEWVARENLKFIARYSGMLMVAQSQAGRGVGIGT